MELTFIEDQQDVLPIQSPEVSAADLDETPLPLPERKQKIARHVRGRSDKESFYSDPTQETPLVTIEEYLRTSSSDSKNATAFKFCINELLSRTACSTYTVARTMRSGNTRVSDSLPSLADFLCDVQLCGKRRLTPNLYRVYQWAIETNFERWSSVPVLVRGFIEEWVGSELLRTKIFSGGSTVWYWTNGLKERGKPSGQRAVRTS